jgi:hypothetical protein
VKTQHPNLDLLIATGRHVGHWKSEVVGVDTASSTEVAIRSVKVEGNKNANFDVAERYTFTTCEGTNISMSINLRSFFFLKGLRQLTQSSKTYCGTL